MLALPDSDRLPDSSVGLGRTGVKMFPVEFLTISVASLALLRLLLLLPRRHRRLLPSHASLSVRPSVERALSISSSGSTAQLGWHGYHHHRAARQLSGGIWTVRSLALLSRSLLSTATEFRVPLLDRS